MNSRVASNLNTKSRFALPLLLYLWEMAEKAGRLRLTLQRDKLGRRFGVKDLDTITAAMGALKAEKLISFKVRARAGSDGKARGKYWEVSLRKTGFNPLSDLLVSLCKTGSNPLRFRSSCWAKPVSTGLLSSKEDRNGASPSKAAVSRPALSAPSQESKNGESEIDFNTGERVE